LIIEKVVFIRQINLGVSFKNFFQNWVYFESNYQGGLFFKAFRHYYKRNMMWQGQHGISPVGLAKQAWHFAIGVSETGMAFCHWG